MAQIATLKSDLGASIQLMRSWDIKAAYNFLKGVVGRVNNIHAKKELEHIIGLIKLRKNEDALLRLENLERLLK